MAWGNAASINKIETLQKRALRIINRRKYNSHTDPLFRANKIPKVVDLFEIQLGLFVYDFKHGKLPFSFHDYFNRAVIPNPRRPSDLPRNQARPLTNFTETLPPHYFVSVWNSFPRDLKEIERRNSLKRMIKLKHMESYRIIVNCNNPHCPDCR